MNAITWSLGSMTLDVELRFVMKKGILMWVCWGLFFFLLLDEAGVFMGSMLFISICSSNVGKSGKFCCWVHSLSWDMLYTMGLQYTLGLSLRKTGLGWTWNLPSILVRHDTSATAVHLNGMCKDLDRASVFPSKFSSVSKTSFSSIHSFLVPCCVHPIEIAFGMVKSLPKMIGLLIFVQTMNEFVKVCSLIVKLNIVIPFASMSWPVAPLRVGTKLVFKWLILSFS